MEQARPNKSTSETRKSLRSELCAPNTPLLNSKNPELHRRSGLAVLGFLLVLFTPPGKFLVGAFDVVAALHMVAGALGIVDAGGGIAVGPLGIAAERIA